MSNLHIIIFKRLLALVFPLVGKIQNQLYTFIKFLQKMIKYRGLVFTIKYYKQMRLHCTRYMCGEPLFVNDVRLGIDKDGFPKRLSFIKPLFDSLKTIDLKFCLTILNFSRSWTLSEKEWRKVDINLKTITEPPKSFIKVKEKDIQSFIQTFSLSAEEPSFNLKDIFMSFKSGPQGPASLTAYSNLLLYKSNLIRWIYNVTDVTGRLFLSNSIDKAFVLQEPPKYHVLGKLSVIRDPEAKMRVIAISDYFTQIYLKKIHEQIMSLLKHFNCDRTFTQDPIHSWSDNEESFWSLDLSSATDRFPLWLQQRLLNSLYNKRFSSSWSNILKERPFAVNPELYNLYINYERYLNGSNESFEMDEQCVKYATGQPMGTYSSWAVFTLCHHFIVFKSAMNVGLTNFDQYIILGDDIVIKNDAVAKEYIKIMTGLGVEISMHKTHKSKNFYEFAKRWIHWEKRVEVTGVPLKGLISNIKSSRTVFTILYDYFKIKRNFNPCSFTLIELTSRLIKGLPVKIKTKKKKVKTIFLNVNINDMKRLSILNFSLDFEFGFATYDSFRKMFLDCLPRASEVQVPGKEIWLLLYKRILSLGMVQTLYKFNLAMQHRPELINGFFQRQMQSKSLYGHPQFLGLLNSLISQYDIIKSYNENDSLTLRNAAKNMISIDYTTIFNKDRNKVQDLLTVGDMTWRAFKILDREMINNDSWFELLKSWYPEDDYTRKIEYVINQSTYLFLKDNPQFTEIEPFNRFNTWYVESVKWGWR